jgi:hemoglobin-like flavoprotein
MHHQAVVLTMQLSVIDVFYTRGTPASDKYLQVLGTRDKDRGIPREHYVKFRDVLLDALERFHGSDWSESLAGHWKKAIDQAAEKMFEGYESRFHM